MISLISALLGALMSRFFDFLFLGIDLLDLYGFIASFMTIAVIVFLSLYLLGYSKK